MSRSSSRDEPDAPDERLALTVHVVGMALEADPRDRAWFVSEDPPVVGVHVSLFTHPLPEPGWAGSHNDEHAVNGRELIGPDLHADRRLGIPDIQNGFPSFEHNHQSRRLIVSHRLADVAAFRKQ